MSARTHTLARSAVRSTTAVAAVALAVLAGAPAASGTNAVPSAPGWEISSVAQPTSFSTADDALCKRSILAFCDRYVVTLTNVGGAPADGSGPPIVIADRLPAGLRPVAIEGANLEDGIKFYSADAGWECLSSDTTCSYSGVADPGTTLVVDVEVEVVASGAPVTNTVQVSGGGAPALATSEPLTMPNPIDGSPSSFGFSAFGFEAHNAAGLLDSVAADHPFGVTSTFSFNTAVIAEPQGLLVPASAGTPKNLAVTLPLGFLGDPTAAAQCTEVQLNNGGNTTPDCPAASRVGTFVFFEENIVTGTVVGREGGLSAVYNMVPQAGFPARFGLKVSGVPVALYATLVHTTSGYALRVATPGLPTTLHIEGVALTFFGNPREAAGEPNGSESFFTNPDDCSAGPLGARVQADSWENPESWIEAESVAFPHITGCNLLQFEPTVELHPEVTQSEAPSGEEIDIKVPQSPEQFPVLATPQLKGVTMTLPEGMTVSPGGGSGLQGCEASGPNGIDMPTNLPEGRERTPVQAGEGEAIGQEGMTQLVAGHCPLASQIGTVQITTPVLKNPLEGHLYIAQPKCGGVGQAECTAADAGDGNLFGLYLEAGSEELGSVVKLKGSVSVDPSTGQLTARFLENPQLPVSEVSIQLKGGARAPLANPRQCGPASANADLTPWSAPVTPDALISSPAFAVDWNGVGEQCPGSVPFAPSLVAGPTSAAAGRFSPFTFTLTRGDRQQDLARVQERMPVGLLGMLKDVTQCPEPQASQGDCSEDSRIGTVTVAAGSGSAPLWVQGRVYLTGPYAGAPFGLSIVVPAKAGPFNLGNVVVRSAISIDPSTSALTVTSDPLPQFRDGVPLRIQTLNVTIDRPGFMFNPTNCAPKQITASIEAQQGASANLSAPFAVEGCKSLPFKPSFKVSTQGKASKASGASLSVSVSSKGGPQAGGGEANIRSVRVELPKQLPARLTTLQKACVAKVFEVNPALCPKESDVGSAKAVTPVLAHPLVGPAYLVSHGGAAFPDLEVVLQGEGIVLVLDGQTNIKRGITSSDFAMVPDAPVSSFSLTLPQGKFSALTSNVPAKAKFSLCGQVLKMPTTLTGQNGVVVKQSTTIGIAGCAKAKKKAKAGKAGVRRGVRSRR